MTTISTIEEAVTYAQQLRDHPSEVVKDVTFDGELKTLTIEIEGPGFHGEMTGELARALAELQDEIYRATAFALWGREGRNGRLSTAQREAVEISIDVTKGCTLINIDLGKLSEGLVDTLQTLSGTQLTFVVVSAIAIFAFGWLGGKWITEHYKSKSDLKGQDEESKRLATAVEGNKQIVDALSKLIATEPKVARFAEASSRGLKEIATRASGATSVSAGRTHMDEADLAALKRRAPRSAPEPILETTRFRILHIDGTVSPFRLTLGGPPPFGEFVVDFDQYDFAEEQSALVWDAFKSREEVVLTVQASVIRGHIKGAFQVDIGSPNP